MPARPPSGEGREVQDVAAARVGHTGGGVIPKVPGCADGASRAVMVTAIVLFFVQFAAASPEVVVRGEFDSNVNRGITARESDGSLSIQVIAEKQPTGESRYEWLYAASLQATAYVKYDDLDYAELSLSSGLLYRPRINVTAALTPLIQFRAVRDSAQSAVTVGAQASLSEQVSTALSLTQYYAYRRSVAKDDTYSFGAHSVGVSGDVVLSRGLQGMLSYELSYGDSYRGVGPVGGQDGKGGGQGRGGTQGDGQGEPGRFSPLFQQGIIKEKVTRHAAGMGVQIDLGRSWSGVVQCVLSVWDGDSGTSRAQSLAFSISHRF